MEGEKIGSSRMELGVCWLVGGLFIFAGVLKALDPAEFASDIANYQLLPWTGAVAGSFYLPWLEIFSGAALVFGVWKSGAIRILLLLMLAFLQALFAAWLRGLNIHCGCFGKALATSNYELLFLRDATILGGLLWLLWAEWKRRIAEEEIAENEPGQI